MGAGVDQPRQPRRGLDGGGGQQLFDQRPDRVRAEEPGLVHAAGVQQAIGEGVPPLVVGGELDLVDGHEVHVVLGHRLDRAHPVTRPRRDALLLAGDQRHLLFAQARRHAVVDLAREQAQRQADHAAAMPKHLLDGAVGLAGVGGPEERRDAGPGGLGAGRGRPHRAAVWQTSLASVEVPGSRR
jgi:hypothetical protein